MLGNSIVRNPRTDTGIFDKGVLCELLRFFAKTNSLIDHSTLHHIVKAHFLDDLIEMLTVRLPDCNYSSQFTGLYNETVGRT